LACIWGSLRFSDAARTSPKSLSVDGWVLRGTAWKTKVCSRGTPFGVIGAGLLGNFPEWGWVHKWLCALSKWVSVVPSVEREGIDFLLPHFAMDGSSVSSEPMSYTTAVLRLRHMLGKLGIENTRAYTAHSGKATVISWGRQLDVSDVDLAKQGHHKVALGHCAGLYGRDDVFQALKVQTLVLSRLREGWRPLTAQRRGAEQPLQEPCLGCTLKPLSAKEFGFKYRVHFKPPLTPDATRVVFPIMKEPQASNRPTNDNDQKAKKTQAKKLLLLGAGVPLTSL
jgi:hypothetical protein